MSGLGWIGGIIDGLFSIGNAYEKKQLSKGFGDIAERDMDFGKSMSADMLAWARQDLDRFKAQYRPVGEGLAIEAAKGPDYGKAEGKVSADIAQQAGQAQRAALAGGMRRGVSPASGNVRAAMLDVAGGAAGAEAGGLHDARRGEDRRVLRNRLAVLKANSGIPAESNVIGAKGMDLTALSARRAAGLSDAYAGAASEAMHGVGKSLSGTDWSGAPWNKPKQDDDGWGNYDTSDYYDSSGNMLGFRHGGLIRGPGTSRSDSIPAVIDGAAPARVSDGEYYIPPEVVAKVGRHYLDTLRARFGDVEDAEITTEVRHG